MTTPSLNDLALVPWFTAGLVSGALYFCCVAWNARQFARHRAAGMTLLLMLGRIVILGGVLTLAARHGTMPLLLMALGVFLARSAVMRMPWRAAS